MYTPLDYSSYGRYGNPYQDVISDAAAKAGMPNGELGRIAGIQNQLNTSPGDRYMGGGSGRQEDITRQRVNAQNQINQAENALAPYIQDSMARRQLRQQEDLRKYQQDYRQSLYDPTQSKRVTYVPGSADRMQYGNPYAMGMRR